MLAIAVSVQAAHLKGGYIEYTYLGVSPTNPQNVQYQVTVYQYIECSSTGGQIDNDVILGVYKQGNNLPTFTVLVPLSNTRFISKGNFDCITNAPTVCYRIDSYSTTIQLPIDNEGYVVTVQRCCRIANIANIQNSNTAGITYSIKINTGINNTAFSNSSPVFAAKDTALVCASNGFKLPFDATDPDGDSLVYSFTAGQNTPSAEAKPNPPLPPPFPAVLYNVNFQSLEPMGSGVHINRSTGEISGIAPPTSGEYVVAVLVEEYRNGQKIGETRKELHVSVGNCEIPRAILPATIVNCNDYTISFQNQSTSSGILTYDWDFGVTTLQNDTSKLTAPVFTYSDTGVYMVKLLVNKEGRCPDSTFGEVRVFPGFTPNFRVDGVCQQLPYQFTDLTTTRYGVVNAWNWDFGVVAIPNDVSILQNPAYTYNAVGLYNPRLIVSSNKGCIDTITLPLNVSDKPVVQLPFRDTLICSIDSLTLRANGTGSFVWSPTANMLNVNTATPVVFPKSTTTYQVTLNDRGCVATDSVRVRVLDFIEVHIGNDTSICRTDSWRLNTQSEALSFRWTPSSLFDDANAKQPLVTAVDSITKIVVNANLGKCQAADSIIIRAVPYPTAFAGNDSTICFGGLATLRGTGNGAITTWNPASLLRGGQRLVTTAAPVNSTAFVLTVSDTLGCPKPVRDTILITVRPRITLFAGNDTSVVYNQLLQLNAATNASNVVWTPPIALSNAFVANPTAIFSAGTLPSGTDSVRYFVTASTPEGCSANDDILVRIFKTGPSIFVPSGFTPNNDGLNDQLRPILAGMKSLQFFRIYNRYGQLIFETKEPLKGWDGRFKGNVQPSGTYVYQCQAIDFEGNTQAVKGSFVLIR